MAHVPHGHRGFKVVAFGGYDYLYIMEDGLLINHNTTRTMMILTTYYGSSIQKRGEKNEKEVVSNNGVS